MDLVRTSMVEPGSSELLLGTVQFVVAYFCSFIICFVFEYLKKKNSFNLLFRSVELCTRYVNYLICIVISNITRAICDNCTELGIHLVGCIPAVAPSWLPHSVQFVSSQLFICG